MISFHKGYLYGLFYTLNSFFFFFAIKYYCDIVVNGNLLFIPARLFFSDLSYLVIDEADSMFDGNFKRDTMDLLQSISVRRTTLLAKKIRVDLNFGQKSFTIRK